MLGKIKYGKILLVVFLTVLIWVVADLAKTERYSASGVITVAKSADPGLWVSFSNKSSASIDNIVLKGPASKILQAKRQLDSGEVDLKFSLNPAEEEMTVPDERPYSLNVLNFLRRSDRIKELGLTVESCRPSILSVNVIRLVERSLDIECVDEDEVPVKTETVDPPKVEMFVPEDWVGGAKVRLTDSEIDQAKHSAIVETPYIELASDQIRYATTPVEIKALPDEDRLTSQSIAAPRLMIALSMNLQGKYEAKVINLNDVVGPIAIKATSDARRAYKDQPFQMTLYILDEDTDSAEPRKEVFYNFPEEYVRKNEIKLDQQPVEAQFELTPLSENLQKPQG